LSGLQQGEEAIEPGKLQSQVEFVRSLTEAAAQQSLRFLYVSTALVFSGKSRDPYKPSDSPDPQNPIAWTHWQSEWAVAEQLESYQIVRSSWVYGGGGNDWISMGRDALKRGEKVYGREDEIGTPTSVADLAQVLVKLTRTEASGVFHVAASGCCSRRECLCRVAEFLDLNSDLVQPLSESDTAERDRPAIRTVLDCTRTWTLGIPALPSWEKGLRSFINQQE
jgi:dTDP-4-dehydrorhamnose reductase